MNPYQLHGYVFLGGLIALAVFVVLSLVSA